MHPMNTTPATRHHAGQAVRIGKAPQHGEAVRIGKAPKNAVPVKQAPKNAKPAKHQDGGVDKQKITREEYEKLMKKFFGSDAFVPTPPQQAKSKLGLPQQR